MNIKQVLFISSLLPFTFGAAQAADMAKAKRNYDMHCAACHGFNGMSNTPTTPNLRMNPGLLQGDFQLVQKLKRGSATKPPIVLSDADLSDVLTYARNIR